MAKRGAPQRIRAIPIRIDRVDGPKDWRAQLRTLSEEVKRINNDVGFFWLQWHLDKGHDQLVREWVATYRRIQQADPKGKAPKCPVESWPKELGKQIWHWIVGRHRGVNSRVVALAINRAKAQYTTMPASNGAWKRWIRVLCGDGEMPTYSNRLPIPFDRQNGRLQRDDAGYQLSVGVARVVEPGKRRATPNQWILSLRTKGRKLDSLRTIMGRVLAGEYKYMGSSIVENDDGWYVLLSYELPPVVKADLNPDRVALLSPAVGRPVDLWIDGHKEGLRRRGRLIEVRMRAISAQFRSRQKAYHYASSASKGHGRKRATRSWVHKLERARQDLKSTYNQQLAHDVVQRCVQLGHGTLVFYMPDDRRKKTRFLELAGKLDRFDRKSSWDWFQFKTLLARRCEDEGVRFCEAATADKDMLRKGLWQMWCGGPKNDG